MKLLSTSNLLLYCFFFLLNLFFVFFFNYRNSLEKCRYSTYQWVFSYTFTFGYSYDIIDSFLSIGAVGNSSCVHFSPALSRVRVLPPQRRIFLYFLRTPFNSQLCPSMVVCPCHVISPAVFFFLHMSFRDVLHASTKSQVYTGDMLQLAEFHCASFQETLRHL